MIDGNKKDNFNNFNELDDTNNQSINNKTQIKVRRGARKTFFFKKKYKYKNYIIKNTKTNNWLEYNTIDLFSKNINLYRIFRKKIKPTTSTKNILSIYCKNTKINYIKKTLTYFKIDWFLNVSSYKLFFNILLFYPFLFLNYSNWSFYKTFLNKLHYKKIDLNKIEENKLYYDLSFFTHFGLFLELQTNKNVNLRINKNYFNDISLFFKIILDLWAYRIRRFFRIFNASFDLYYIVKLFFLVVKNKDIHLLMKIITKITPKIDFQKHRRFFKFIIYMFRCYYSLVYGICKLQGFQFEFRGKISVDGNARTRKMYAKILRPSPSNYSYSTRYIYKTVKTHTGILGLKIWIYYTN